MLALLMLALVVAPVFTAFECGIANTYHSGLAKIVGGRPERFFKFPWFAALHRPYVMDHQECAGALIAPQYVMTAANCFDHSELGLSKEEYYHVTLGIFNQCKDTPSTAITYKVSNVYIHPKYGHALDFGDIALMKLVRSSEMMPVCLPPKGVPIKHVNNATILGFGRLEMQNEEQPCEINEATVEIYTNEECRNQSSYSRSIIDAMVDKQNSFCAGTREGGIDTCLGDSGGSILIKKSKRYFSMGVSSSGYVCGYKEYPGIYTNVASYIGWINDTMGGELKLYRPKSKKKPFPNRLVHFVTG